MRRRILESAILEALWLGPLLGAPVALAHAMHRAGPIVPWLLALLAVLVGARRSVGRDLGPLLVVVGVAEVWAVWASAAPLRDAIAGALPTILLTTGVAWIFVPALARSLEPNDTLEAHFPRTVLADSAAILGAVSLAVLFDLHMLLGFVASLVCAIMGQAAPALRIRTGLAVLGGALLHVWLGLDDAIAVASTDPAAALADLVQRGALTTATVTLAAIVLARSEPRHR